MQATPGPAKIMVSWKAADKPNLAGYIVERSFLESGPYEALMSQALPAATGRYEDDAVRGGTAYYYRVRAISPRGDLGPPSHSAMAQPSNPGKPPKVAGLASDPGETRVRLTWQPVAFPVAGYFVERRAASSNATASSNASAAVNWVRLNPHVTPEAIYDDYIGSASATRLEYRVVAIAFDNGEGLPSDPVDVTLPSRTLPDQPSIIRATGAQARPPARCMGLAFVKPHPFPFRLGHLPSRVAKASAPKAFRFPITGHGYLIIPAYFRAKGGEGGRYALGILIQVPPPLAL